MSAETPARRVGCPDEEQLRAFLLDTLQGAGRVGVGSHIDACPACQAVLDRLSDGTDGLVARLRGPALAVSFPEALSDQLLERVQEPATEPHTEPQAPPPGLGPPQLPGYEVLGVIGQGGNGTVFMARDQQTGKTVALKIPRSQAAPDAEARGRFLREVQTMGSLQHPNLVPLLQAGESGGTALLVM